MAVPLGRPHSSFVDLGRAASLVRVCRQKRGADRETTRVYCMMTEGADQQMLREAFARIGACMADGQALMGYLESELAYSFGRRRDPHAVYRSLGSGAGRWGMRRSRGSLVLFDGGALRLRLRSAAAALRVQFLSGHPDGRLGDARL